MEFFKRLLPKIIIRFFSLNNISKFVLYKIVDVTNKNIFILQCVNYKTIFQADIAEIIYNKDILYGLHPLQSCFIGIEYAKYLKINQTVTTPHIKDINSVNKQYVHEYGLLKLKYQNRRGQICYINSGTNEEIIMYPKDIAFSDNIIGNFHAEEAFYIGVCAGLKIHNLPPNVLYLNFKKELQLKNS